MTLAVLKQKDSALRYLVFESKLLKQNMVALCNWATGQVFQTLLG